MDLDELFDKVFDAFTSIHNKQTAISDHQDLESDLKSIIKEILKGLGPSNSEEIRDSVMTSIDTNSNTPLYCLQIIAKLYNEDSFALSDLNLSFYLSLSKIGYLIYSNLKKVDTKLSEELSEFVLKFLINSEEKIEKFTEELDREEKEYFNDWFKTTFQHAHRINSEKDIENEFTGFFAQFLTISFEKYPKMGLLILNQLDHSLEDISEEVKTEEERTVTITKYHFKDEEKDIDVILPTVTDLKLRLLNYFYDLTRSKIDYQLKLGSEIQTYLCDYCLILQAQYNAAYLNDEILKVCYQYESDLLHHNHANVLETFESIIQIFNNITAEGDNVDSICQHLFNNKAHEGSISLITLVDNLLAKLIELGAVPKNDDDMIPKMEDPVSRSSTHPVAGLLTKCIRLVGNLIAQCSSTVGYFENNMTQLGLILSHTKFDFVNSGLREQAFLCAKYLIDKSAIIRENLGNITSLNVDEEGKELLKKVGLEEGFFLDKDKIDMVQSPFMEEKKE